ncbi:MAG: hypothetical protein ACFFC6_11305 [Promethearchaeota archaeon]
MPKKFDLENFIIQFMRIRGFTVYDKKMGETGRKVSVPEFARELAGSSLKNKLKTTKYSEARHPINANNQPNRKVWYCYQCGAYIKNQKFCHKCGRELIWP